MENRVVYEKPVARWSPGLAVLLSLLIPGAGQMYKGYPFWGLLWFGGTVAGYAFFIIPGIVLHLLCILSAALGNPYK